MVNLREQARELCLASGVADPPGLLIEAVAGLRGLNEKREFIASWTPQLLRRIRMRETPKGRLELQLEEAVAEELADLRHGRGNVKPEEITE